MMYLVVLVVIISFIEIKRMADKQQKKEIVVFFVLAVISLVVGFFYLSDPYRTSLAQQMLKVIGQQF